MFCIIIPLTHYVNRFLGVFLEIQKQRKKQLLPVMIGNNCFYFSRFPV